MEELRRYRIKLKEIHKETSRRAQDPGYTEGTRIKFAEIALHTSRAIESTRGPVPESTAEHDAAMCDLICTGEYPS